MTLAIEVVEGIIFKGLNALNDDLDADKKIKV